MVGAASYSAPEEDRGEGDIEAALWPEIQQQVTLYCGVGPAYPRR